MPRGIPAKTKAEKIAKLIARRWSRQRIIEKVGCHEIYYYQVRRKLLDAAANSKRSARAR